MISTVIRPFFGGCCYGGRSLLPALGSSLSPSAALALGKYGTKDVLFWEADIGRLKTDEAVRLYRDGSGAPWWLKATN